MDDREETEFLTEEEIYQRRSEEWRAWKDALPALTKKENESPEQQHVLKLMKREKLSVQTGYTVKTYLLQAAEQMPEEYFPDYPDGIEFRMRHLIEELGLLGPETQVYNLIGGYHISERTYEEMRADPEVEKEVLTRKAENLREQYEAIAEARTMDELWEFLTEAMVTILTYNPNTLD